MPRVRAPDAAKVVCRTARIELRTTPGQRARCFGLLRAGGDLWACVLLANEIRRRGGPLLVTYQDLCAELSSAGPGCFGDLSSVGARSILRRYSDAWMTTSRLRKKAGSTARFLRRRRGLVPSRYYHGTFSLEDRRLTLPVARGCPPLHLRLTRPSPYEEASVRSVTLLNQGTKLFVDVTAEIEVASKTLCDRPPRVAGIDLGIIHPYVVVARSGALLVSGRAQRAESRLHLADTKARRKAVAKRSPAKGQAGSRRWRTFRARQKKTEARHLRRLDQARHEAAGAVISFAREHEIDTLVVGDPRALLFEDSGHRQNLAIREWRVGRLIGCLSDKAEVAGIEVVLVDERGTSSTCPRCLRRVTKPKGRNFFCPHCFLVAHRDLVGAANIASRDPRGGTPVDLFGLTITHRRAGRHLPGRTRRDPRRVQMDLHRSRLGPWPAVARPGEESQKAPPGESLARDAVSAWARNHPPS